MSDGAVLVTGAGGFVCSEIALALHRSGLDVVAVDQVFDGPTAARLTGIRQIVGPLTEVLESGALGAVSAVIHGAAITASPERLSITRATHIRRNTDLLTAALDFACTTGASRFLFVSSTGVFEPHDTQVESGHVTEATQPTATRVYCAAKRAGELLTTSAAQDGFATLSLRLGDVFGAHEALRESRQHLCLVSRMLAEARGSGGIAVQTPEAIREWSWLSNLAREIAQLIQQLPMNCPRVLHAGTPPVITDLYLARAIAARQHGTTIRIGSPPFAVIRPPMASEASSIFDGTKWTPIEAALDEMIQLAGKL